MKTTNLEISKKLKEIGFEAKTDKCWAKIRNSKLDKFSIRTLDFSIPANCDEWYPAYDLETLLDALPTNKHDFFIQFDEPIKIGSYEPCGEYRGHYDMREGIFESCQKENESLADTAGRLLIKLYEAGIINFKK